MLRRDHIPFQVEEVRDEVAVVMAQYLQMSAEEQLAFQYRLNIEHGAKLLRAAQELAARAIRNQSAEDVKLGLLAVTLEGIRNDYRETCLALCLLYNSAKKLGLEPQSLFRHMAEYGNSNTKKFILEYLKDGSKSLADFAIAENYGPNGFDYITTGM